MFALIGEHPLLISSNAGALPRCSCRVAPGVLMVVAVERWPIRPGTPEPERDASPVANSLRAPGYAWFSSLVVSTSRARLTATVRPAQCGGSSPGSAPGAL